MAHEKFSTWHGTTIIGVKKNGKVVIAGDGQVSLGQTVIKGTAKKVRKLSPGGHDVIAGFAGSTADAFALFERYVSIVPQSYTADVSALFWSWEVTLAVVAKPEIAESTSVFK